MVGKFNYKNDWIGFKRWIHAHPILISHDTSKTLMI
jgi:hypothetical protein